MFLGTCVAAGLFRFGRGALARHAVLADEPAPQVDRAATRRAERERRVLLPGLYVDLASGTARHAVVVGAASTEFKRVATDNGKVKD